MAAILTRVRRPGRASERREAAPEAAPAQAEPEGPRLDIAPDDPILALLQTASGPVEVEKLQLDSPAVRQMKQAGLKLIVPLVSQGELIGLLNLGPRLSEQDYSADDRKLLANLAAQAAPAVRVAQLVKEQEAEARERERVEHELQVAQLIQQNFLPKRTPDVPGWQLAAHYRPAREVGGDFYDFIELPEGRIGLVIGDVTGKGVPAALVMAATRSVLRGAAPRLVEPGPVMARVNDLMCEDMPPKMFVTCQYFVLDPATGRLVFANAGHDLPYVRGGDGVRELRATGMPLGLMPGMPYDPVETTLEPDETMILTSDGVAECHAPDGEMFGFPRMQGVMAAHPGGIGLIDHLLSEQARFVGPDWEQEDDVTIVAIARSPVSVEQLRPVEAGADGAATRGELRTLASFEVPSEAGNEREVMDRVAEAVAGTGLPPKRLERLKTASAEAAMNAMEHGNGYRQEVPVQVVVSASDDRLVVAITDHGGGRDTPEPETPDLEAKLEGLQKPRGWGLFLIKEMVDELAVGEDGSHHTVELVMHLGSDA